MNKTTKLLYCFLLLILAGGCGDLWLLDQDLTCGDNVVDTANGEVCDGADLASKTCVTEGFSGGTLKCTADCSNLDTTSCYKCGDGIKHPLEPCDGTNLGGLSCTDSGYTGGVLGCKKDCSGVEPTGCYQWSIPFHPFSHPSDNGFGHAIALDREDNRYIGGAFSGSIFFDTGSITARGGSDAFVIKQDSTGKELWGWSGGGTGNNDDDHARGIAVDKAGNSYVTGSFSGSLVFLGQLSLQPSPGPLKSEGGTDIFVVKLDPDGKVIWVTTTGGTGNDESLAIAMDGADNIIITGSYQNSFKFGDTPFTATTDSASKTTSDIFVAKLKASTGDFTWATPLGSDGTAMGKGLAVDSKGNSYVTGSFSGKGTFGSPALTSTMATATTHSTDIFVAKLDSQGKVSWAKQAGGKERDTANAIALDKEDGALVLTGGFGGTATFGTLPVVTASKGVTGGDSHPDLFLARMTAKGTFSWVISAGEERPDEGQGVAVDSAGNIHMTGWIRSTTKLGDFNLPCSGYQNLFMAKLDRTGDVIRSAAPIIPTGGSSGMTNMGSGVAADSSGRGYMAGTFYQSITVGNTLLTATGAGNLVVLSLYTTPYLFQTMASGTTEDLKAAWGSSPQDVYAVGGKAAVHFDGKKWSPVNLGAALQGLDLTSIWGSGPKDVLAVGSYTKSDGQSAGVVFQYDGTIWSSTKMSAHTLDTLTAVGGSGSTEVFAIGTQLEKGQRKLMAYSRMGSSWSPTDLGTLPSNDSTEYRQIWAAGPGNLWIVGGDCDKGCKGKILRFLKNFGVGGWAQLALPPHVKFGSIGKIWGPSPMNLYAAGYNIEHPAGQKSGFINHYDGATWTPLRSFQGRLALAIWGRDSNEIWIGQDDGWLLHFDGAKTWTEVPIPALQDLNSIWGTGAADLFIVGDNGTILRKR